MNFELLYFFLVFLSFMVFLWYFWTHKIFPRMAGENPLKFKLILTCVAVSPSNFKLCALRDRDSDGPPNLVAFRSNSIAAARFLNSTGVTHGRKFVNPNDLLIK